MRIIKTVASTLTGLVVACVVVPLVGQYFIALAEEYHWYDRPSERAAAILAFFAARAESPWFHWFGGGIIGFTFGFWLDAVLKRANTPGTDGRVARMAIGALYVLVPSVVFLALQLQFCFDMGFAAAA